MDRRHGMQGGWRYGALKFSVDLRAVTLLAGRT